MNPLPSPSASPETAPRVRRSVFGNYAPTDTTQPEEARAEARRVPTVDAGCGDVAFSRSFVYQFLARAFEYPSADTWAWLCDPEVHGALKDSLAAIQSGGSGGLTAAGLAVLCELRPDGLADLHDDYIVAVGHAARGSCPINEIEYGDLNADPLIQPHRLAELAAFYRAFGVELGPDAGERQDHLAVELEFMAVLAAQEAGLLNTRPDGEALLVCLDAQFQFLRVHLGRWLPAFVRRLDQAVGTGRLGALGRLALAFVEDECRRRGVTPGSADLMMRPADAGGALCESCGLNEHPPGGEPQLRAADIQGWPGCP